MAKRSQKTPDFETALAELEALVEKMEQGDLSVVLGKYYSAAQVLGLEQSFATLLKSEESLFDD